MNVIFRLLGKRFDFISRWENNRMKSTPLTSVERIHWTDNDQLLCHMTAWTLQALPEPGQSEKIIKTIKGIIILIIYARRARQHGEW
ncbi:MAG: hypothetical protein GF313_01680 [Caldithrix sp.]|nr:hypothetical protein [Caldithrix sp.]